MENLFSLCLAQSRLRALTSAPRTGACARWTRSVVFPFLCLTSCCAFHVCAGSQRLSSDPSDCTLAQVKKSDHTELCACAAHIPDLGLSGFLAHCFFVFSFRGGGVAPLTLAMRVALVADGSALGYTTTLTSGIEPHERQKHRASGTGIHTIP